MQKLILLFLLLFSLSNAYAQSDTYSTYKITLLKNQEVIYKINNNEVVTVVSDKKLSNGKPIVELNLRGKFVYIKTNVLGFKHYTAQDQNLYIPVYTMVQKIINIHDAKKVHINDFNLDLSVKVTPELNEFNLIEIVPLEENINNPNTLNN